MVGIDRIPSAPQGSSGDADRYMEFVQGEAALAIEYPGVRARFENAVTETDTALRKLEMSLAGAGFSEDKLQVLVKEATDACQKVADRYYDAFHGMKREENMFQMTGRISDLIARIEAINEKRVAVQASEIKVTWEPLYPKREKRIPQ